MQTLATWLEEFIAALEDMSVTDSRSKVNEVLQVGAGPEGPFSGPAWQRLEEAERRILLVAAAPELELDVGRLYADVTEKFSVSRPTVAIVLHLAASSMHERLLMRQLLSSSGELIQGGWLQIEESPGRTWLESEARVSSTALQLLMGQTVIGTGRDSLCRIWQVGPTLTDVVLPPSTLLQIDHFLQRARHHRSGDDSLVLLLLGPSGTGKTITARAIAAELGRPLLLVDPLGGVLRRDELENRLEQMTREVRLLGGILFFDECEGWFEARTQGDRTVLRMLELLDRQDAVVILATNLPEVIEPALDRRVALRLEFKIPTRPYREALWRLHLAGCDQVDPEVDFAWLAERYEISGGHIANAAEAAIQLARHRGTEASIEQKDLEEAADQQVRHRLSRLAVETPTNLSLDDLIVPDPVRSKLIEIIEAVRNRRMLFEEWGFGRKLSTGRGLCILFRGDPGTGKTLAAEVLASELKMPLYRASIPKIVSKYVGETERNLERTFREATAARGILLFDEADALFSKRVDVSTAQDRYANMEVNLLLQEIERFDGVVILTTNLTAAIDQAFERRLNFKVDFPFPDPKERARIWKRLIPDEAPVQGPIDFDLMGEGFELSGGSIKNAVLRAAYAAAQAGTPITMEGLEAASVKEYRELGKLISDRRWD
ncbi:MAG: ATP-binding protein [Bradymonadales bacterium]|nr:ATP-binding protein [Bradymonadales bacterium]